MKLPLPKGGSYIKPFISKKLKNKLKKSSI